MKILVINAGSSSLKYQLFDMDTESVIAKGQAEKIGLPEGLVKQSSGRGVIEYALPVPDHTTAMEYVVKALTDAEKGVIRSLDEIDAIGHRVLHGGADFTKSEIVSEPIKQAVRENFVLGPLHNPANLAGIEVCEKLMPGKPNIAVFDTAFHQTMPDYAFMYGVPYAYYEKYKLRRYGFHGTSHRFVSGEALRRLGKGEGGHSKIIVCHLGNGSSLSAVVDGKCVDTSMGITPLEGLIMGTRAGDIDPAALQYIMSREGLSIEEMTDILNKKSGLLGVSGVTSDMRDLSAAAESGNERAKLAIDMMCYRIRKYIGSFMAAMNGADAIVFTGGIGENDASVREKVLSGLSGLGVKLDAAKNKATRGNGEITEEGSPVRALVVATNEELAIARDTKALCQA
ncbi:MAG: acetate kinase [Christensenellaceae bacterium]|jgi:acetate kinase|nr:acetate kinase [Christensenellaceae bacterium]